MTYEEIFSKSKEIIMQADVTGFKNKLAVQVNIIGEGEGAFYIELKDEKLSVEPYEYYDRDCILILTGEDFLKLANNQLNPVAAFTTGKLKVEGSIDKALEFQKIVEAVKAKPAKAEKAEKAEKAAAPKAEKPAKNTKSKKK